MRIVGIGGEVRAGPRVAATLGAWVLEHSPEAMDGGRWSFAAAVRGQDAFWSRHGGVFDLVVSVGTVAWVWHGVEAAWGEQGVNVGGIGKPEVGVWAPAGS